MEVIQRVFNRVLDICRVIFDDKLRNMDLPPLTPEQRIHKAHWWGLGSFQAVEDHSWDPALTSGQQLNAELEAMARDRPPVQATMRYALMILHFERLTRADMTGCLVMFNAHNPQLEQRELIIRVYDPLFGNQDLEFLNHLYMPVQTTDDGRALVFKRIVATSWVHPASYMDPFGNYQTNHVNCICVRPDANHYFYVVDSQMCRLVQGCCPMPARPAIFLTGDSQEDPRHQRACLYADEGRHTITNTCDNQNRRLSTEVQANMVDRIEPYMRAPVGYAKLCVDIDGRFYVASPELWAYLPNTNALYVRRDLIADQSSIRGTAPIT
ncbi:hypothetical protein B0H66DRAFT_603589 [Apodospora peruviana]|uniref:Uncharacterized protein n=1 Tax=Apodospora peruviana TaxID=516989 RepID=A0AAE0I623_9PEZI|nr:hypothetical protein B0H66DRAFT_603589 [Apodospora peruviana]